MRNHRLKQVVFSLLKNSPDQTREEEEKEKRIRLE